MCCTEKAHKTAQDRWKGPLLLNLMIQNLMATAFHLNSNNFLLDTFSVFVELSLDPVTYSSFVSQSLGFICLLLMEI